MGHRASDNELLALLRISPLTNSLTQRAADRIEELLGERDELITELRGATGRDWPTV